MSLEILRRGSSGSAVRRWQAFLLGQGFLRAGIDGEFGPITEKATRAFQRSQGLSGDAIVGARTLGAALSLGFDVGFTDPQRGDNEPLLPTTSDLKPITAAARARMFGRFEFEPAPTARNPEAIRILDDWEQLNILNVFLPQLKGVPVFGRRSSGRLRFHRAAADQLKAMWAAWEQAGLLDRILSWEGSYNARFIRGSRVKLSNHAFGSAFDINARWNRLGVIPAATGSEGSVRELVAIAEEHGFYWGGGFRQRPDGMHFEVAKLL